ncbi:EAL domain-containing protein [Halioxenophilus sp. WMMB6]|uniref:bifunctional diguanylate cyclase/phosphodiesterase n=1 Tax=Halioxenophilus sp. WMMB6 TaxID=3073815 RepID=UPI00295E3FF7|nr:EAL domain-containing protein [Halioxenophilus sp. WMMB6]
MTAALQDTEVHRHRSRWLATLLSTVVPSAVLPIGVALLITPLLRDSTWANEPVHALVESIGAFIAVLLAVFILVMRSSALLTPCYIWVATTLMGMGLLDGFHAAVGPGEAFVWLHSFATFIGGITFALVILPESLARWRPLNRAPQIMAPVCILLGVGALLYPELLPAMVVDKAFTTTAKALNFIGGAGFIFAWFHFAFLGTLHDRRERLVLANHCLLFGSAGLLFHLSALWDFTWWLWHFLRLLAYLVILWFFVDLYYQMVKRTRQNQLSLEQRSTELEAARQRLSDLIEYSPALISLQDTDGQLTLVNRHFEATLGMAGSHSLGRTLQQLLPGAQSRLSAARDQAVLVTERASTLEEKLTAGGETRTYLSSRFPLRNSSGIYGVGCIRTDISERKAIEERLQLAQKVIKNTGEGVVITNAQGCITDVNDAYCRITGYSYDELIGNNPRITQSGLHDREFYKQMWLSIGEAGFWHGEIWDKRKNGELFPKLLTINTIYDDQRQVSHYVGIFSDITEKKEAEEQLLQLAFYDPLTSLPNRGLFRRRLSEALASALRQEDILALVFIDLDNFKDINDTLGHDVGDSLIQLAGSRIKACVRKTDMVARLGGDEFTVLLTNLHNEDDIGLVAQNIIGALSQPFAPQGHEAFVSASLGIAVFPGDGMTAEELLKNADTAMYHAKASGRSNFQYYRPAMNERLERRVQLTNGLRHALENNEFLLHYQPRLDIDSGKIVGAEALIRWHKPGQGLIPPDEFIAAAEASNLILPISQWVLEAACQQISEWRRQGLPITPVAINLSSKQFQDGNLVALVKNSLAQHALPAHYLEVEITESILMDDPNQAVSILKALRAMGVRIAIDDFGTGYSSLAYLRKLPIDTLKIDRSFVNELHHHTGDAAIVEAIIALAGNLSLGVVAEGVETEEQLAFLQARGCREAQGYLFSRPLPAEAFGRLLSGKGLQF